MPAILDFFMEDIAPYSDEQIGAAARDVHTKTVKSSSATSPRSQ